MTFQTLRRILFIGAFLLGVRSVPWAYYYYQNFSTAPSGWTTGLKYGSDSGITTELGSQALTYNASGVAFSGYIISNTGTLQNLKGYMMRYEYPNNVTAYQPFGYEITRTSMRLDPDMEAAVNDNTADNGESGRQIGSFSMWLVEQKAGITNGNASAVYDNFLNFMELYRPKLETENDDRPYSYLGFMNNKSSGYTLTNLSRANGEGTVDLSSVLQWTYDDRWGKGTTGNFGGTGNANTVNNNTISYRVTSDGNYAYLYVNANPLGLDNVATSSGGTYSLASNEFILLDRKKISFSNNILAMFGLEANRSDGETYTLRVSNFTIRSVCSNLYSELSPYELPAGLTKPLSIVVKPEFSPNQNQEAGIGELYVDLPEGYTWTNQNFTNSIGVFFINSDGNVVKTFSRNYSADVEPAANDVNFSVKSAEFGVTDNRRLKIRFNANNVFHPDHGCGDANTNAILIVVSNFTTLSTADADGKTFMVFANNEKYSDSTWTKTATTGAMRARATNAIAMSNVNNALADGNTLTIKTYNGPVSESSLSPNKVYESMAALYYYSLSTKLATNNNADVSRAFIYVPAGFTVDTAYLYSEKMGVSNGSYLYVSNISGTNTVVVDYQAKGTSLPAGSGVDTISIKTTTTTNVADGETNLRVYWPSSVYSALTGTFTNSATNSFYPDQSLLVRKKPPSVTASISPLSISNTTLSNLYTYTVRNTATEAANQIKLFRIELPAVLTNIRNVVSASNGVVSIEQTNGSNWITISYTNFGTTPISTNGYDLIQFWADDTISSLSVITQFTVKSVADNLNGDGWIAVTPESSPGWSLTYYSPFASGYGYVLSPGSESGGGLHHIYTDLDTNSVTLVIENKGEEGNEISQSRLVFPVGITNVVYLGGTKLGVPVQSNEMIVDGTTTNTQVVIYLQYTNTMKPKIGAQAAQKDQISLTLYDSIDVPASKQIEIYVKNSQTNFSRASEAPENALLTFIYPPIQASGYVTVPPDNFIDWSGYTNTLQYVVSNLGRPKNTLNQLRIAVPSSIASNITEVTSLLIPSSSQYSGEELILNYTNFGGGQYDVLTFKLWDTVVATKTIRLTNVISNDRTNGVLSESWTGAQNVYFRTPPVLANYRLSPVVLFTQPAGTEVTNEIVLTISNRGSGNNHINQLEILAPSVFNTSRIVDIYDEAMNIHSTNSTKISISTSRITMDYGGSSTNLAAGSLDRLHIYLRNNFTNEQTLYWSVQADNDTNDENSLTNVELASGAVSNTYLAEMADVSVSPVVVVTSTESNYFTYSVKNGTVGQSTGRPLQRLRLTVSSPFTNISGLTTEQPASLVTTNVDSSTRQIIVTYTGGLSAGEGDNIAFWLQDNWVIGTNLSVLSAEADYGDGWVAADVENGKSVQVSFEFPPAQSTGYIVAGERVPEDFTSYNYEFYLKNTGDVGNHIRLVRLTPPSSITNISNILSLKGATSWYDGTNIWVNYQGAGNELTNGEIDTIRFLGYDNVDAGLYQSLWGLAAANVTNSEATLVDTIVPGGKNLSNEIYTPDYKASIFVEAVSNSVSSDTNKTSVWTTGTNNTLKLFIYNQSASGNNMTGARIYIPGIPNVFITNGMSVVVSNQGTVVSGVQLSNSGRNVEILFDSPVVPGDYAVATFQLNDALTYGETNLTWNVDAAFNTTDGKLKSAVVYPQKTSVCYFVMPVPVAKSWIVTPTTREIYTSTTNYTMNFALSNAGTGSSDLFKAELTLPSVYRSAFAVSDVSNSMATNVVYQSSSGVITFLYSNNFAPGAVDQIYLKLKSASQSITNYNFASKIWNSTYSNSAEARTSGASSISIVNVPTYYLSTVSGRVENDLSTVTATNSVILSILNDTGGEGKLKKVEIFVPELFTAILATNGQQVTNLSYYGGTLTNFTIDYSSAGKEISGGGSDTLGLSLLDQFEIGDTNAAFRVRGWNGFEWVEFVKEGSYPTNLNFTMPPASAEARLGYNQLFTSVGETNIGIQVVNTATGTGRLSGIRVWVPGIMTNLSILSNTYCDDATYRQISNMLEVRYADTNLLDVGDTDTLWVSFSNLAGVQTNVTFTLEGVNMTNGDIESRYVKIESQGGEGALSFAVDFPDVNLLAYIKGRSTIYTIDTNDQLTFVLRNDAPISALSNVRLYYDPNLVTVQSASNNFTGATYTIESGDSNCLVLSIPDGLYRQGVDEMSLWLNLEYHLSQPTNTSFYATGTLWSDQGGTNGVFKMNAGAYTLDLGVEQADWGKVRSSVFPTNQEVAVKLYFTNTRTLATNIDGETVGTVTGNLGAYDFTHIPSGTYDVVFTSSKFRTVSNTYVVLPNTNNLWSVVTMQNAVLDPDASSNQEVMCYEDGTTKVIFPAGSLPDDFSLDINLLDLTDEQKRDLGNNKGVKVPSQTTGMRGYHFNIRDLPGKALEGGVLKLDAELVLSYSLSDIESRGWTEAALAIYYWDTVSARWIKVGGKVDTTAKTVRAKVSYLHEIYGVFAGTASEGMIRNVTVRPKVFTPSSGTDGYFGSVRITFELDSSIADQGFELKIYDVRGNLVKTFERQNTGQAQGEVAWDGLDDEGYPAKIGVYIYRVTSGSQVYSGTLIIAR